MQPIARPTSLLKPLGGSCPRCGGKNTLGIYRCPWYGQAGIFIGWRDRKRCSECDYDEPGRV